MRVNPTTIKSTIFNKTLLTLYLDISTSGDDYIRTNDLLHTHGHPALKA